MRLLLAGAGLFFSSRGATAACVISGARPTVPLPTMELGQEFSFIASSDCETLRFNIRGTTPITPRPKSGGPVGPGPHTYKVVLTEAVWDAVVAESGSTLTWIVRGTTSTGVVTSMVTTNELKPDEINAIDLSTADAKLVGEELYDEAGFSVSGAGDVDGDGHADLLIGAFEDDAGGAHAGAAYLVRGPVTGTLDLSLADAKLVGEADDHVGWSVSGAGDVDGDGHDDLLVNGDLDVHFTGRGAGAAYLVRGPVSGTVDLSLADAKLVGEKTFDFAGWSVSDAGDVDADGHDDLLVGAVNYSYARTQYAGAAYLVLGPVTGIFDLSMADAKIVGDEWDTAGTSVSGAGDVDGDGHDDFVVGVPGRDTVGGPLSDNGAAFLVLGPVSGTLRPWLADARLVGEGDSQGAGGSVADAGDVDADGHDDLFVGAPQDTEGGSPYAGAAYLVLGPVTGTRSLARADAKLVGDSSYDYAGWSVSGAGDVDSDGHDDLLVGALVGTPYLVLGPVTGGLELSHADAVFTGDASQAVSGAGDVDADGRDDLLVGVWGGAYLIYGGGL
jgi:hypothetical protein